MDATIQSAKSQWAYTEYAQMLRGADHNPDDGRSPEDMQQAARQFESLFIGMWLKSAREATDVIAQDSPFASNALSLHQSMMDQQVAMHMARSGGVGLAEVIVRQMGGAPSPAAGTAPPGEQLAPGEVPQNTVIGYGPRQAAFDNPQSFVAGLAHTVREIASAQKLPPTALLAQAALETG